MYIVRQDSKIHYHHRHHHRLFHDVLLRSYLYHCVWSVITAHNLTAEKRDNKLFAPPRNPHFVPPQQHLTYNWHPSLL